MQAALARFWCRDLPYLDGRLRFLWFSQLLCMTIFSYPPPFEKSARFSQGWMEQQADLFRLHDTLDLHAPTLGLGVDAARSYLSFDVLHATQRALLFSYACCALGLFSWASRLCAAVCCTILQFAQMRHAAHSHSHYLLRDALIFLVVEPYDPRFSLDALVCNALRRVRPLASCMSAPQQQRGHSVARKLILVDAVISLWFAGVFKLWIAGLRWTFGELILLGSEQDMCTGARAPTLSWLLVTRHQWFAPLLASGGLATELASLVCLFSPRSRLWGCAVAIGMHCGIKLFMKASFPFQALCYFLCADWRPLWAPLWQLVGKLGQQLLRTSDEDERCALAGSTEGEQDLHADEHAADDDADWMDDKTSLASRHAPIAPPGMPAALCASLWAVIAVLAALLRVDYWPLTSWALYCWTPDVVDPHATRPTDRFAAAAEWSPSMARAAAHTCLTVPYLTPTCLSAKNHAEAYTRVAARRIRLLFLMRTTNATVALLSRGEQRAHGQQASVHQKLHGLHLLFSDFRLASASLGRFPEREVLSTLNIETQRTSANAQPSLACERGRVTAPRTAPNRSPASSHLALYPSRSLVRRRSQPFSTPASVQSQGSSTHQRYRGLTRTEIVKELKMLLYSPSAKDLLDRPLHSLHRNAAATWSVKHSQTSAFAQHLFHRFTSRETARHLRPYVGDLERSLAVDSVRIYIRLREERSASNASRPANFYVKLGEFPPTTA